MRPPMHLFSGCLGSVVRVGKTVYEKKNGVLRAGRIHSALFQSIVKYLQREDCLGRMSLTTTLCRTTNEFHSFKVFPLFIPTEEVSKESK